jgi:hypothetical protein
MGEYVICPRCGRLAIPTDDDEDHPQTVTRREPDGIELADPRHWESWRTSVYIYEDGPSRNITLNIPVDVARHLDLEHKQRIQVAIKHDGYGDSEQKR